MSRISRMLSQRSSAPYRRSILAAALVAAVAAGAAGAGDPSPAIRWVDGLPQAKSVSDRTGKPMLIVFGADYCGYCKKLDADVFANPQVSRYINEGFVPVHLDTAEDANKRAAQILEVTHLPCSVILAPNADQLGRISGYKEASPYFQDLAAARQLQSKIKKVSR